MTPCGSCTGPFSNSKPRSSRDAGAPQSAVTTGGSSHGLSHSSSRDHGRGVPRAAQGPRYRRLPRECRNGLRVASGGVRAVRDGGLASAAPAGGATRVRRGVDGARLLRGRGAAGGGHGPRQRRHRERVAARPGAMTIASPPRRESRGDRFPDPVRVDEAARILARAEYPIVLTSAVGLDARAVAGLVELAEAGGIGVVEADPIYMNFAHRHDLHLGYNQSGTTNPSLAEAGAVLVVEADVPWYPALQKPAPGAPIIHLGVDPFFSRYPMRSYPCDVPLAATPAAALPLLAEAVRRPADPGAVDRRRARLAAEHRQRHAAWDETVLKQASASTIGFAWASRCIGEIVDESTVVVNEYPLDRRFAAFTRPGSYFPSPPSSGLGLGLGAAPGVKLAPPAATVTA